MAIEQAAASSPTSFSNVKGYFGTLSDKFLMKPRGVAGIAGWVFDVEGESHISVSAEITDHFVEDNSAIQDHVAIRPIRITLRGYKGELVFKPSQFLSILTAVQNRLTSVPAYLGPLTPGGLNKVQKAITQVSNVTNQISQAYNRAKNIFGFFSGSNPAPTEQEKAFSHFLASMNSRTMMVINTPFGTLDKMIIEHVTMVQDESTKSMSDISVTLKQLQIVPIDRPSSEKNSNRRSSQASSRFKKGITKGLTSTTAVLGFFF